MSPWRRPQFFSKVPIILQSGRIQMVKPLLDLWECTYRKMLRLCAWNMTFFNHRLIEGHLVCFQCFIITDNTERINFNLYPHTYGNIFMGKFLVVQDNFNYGCQTAFQRCRTPASPKPHARERLWSHLICLRAIYFLWTVFILSLAYFSVWFFIFSYQHIWAFNKCFRKINTTVCHFVTAFCLW